MRAQTKQILIFGGVLAALLLIPENFSMANIILTRAANFTAGFEGFSATPYWDVNRYSWGYGTRAPGATGTITKSQARAELVAHLQGDYNYLKPLLTVPLNSNQWCALLSFAYNLGDGNADNLVPLINAGDIAGLGDKWNQYVYSSHAVNPDLVKRRAAEFAKFIS